MDADKVEEKNWRVMAARGFLPSELTYQTIIHTCTHAHTLSVLTHTHREKRMFTDSHS